MFRGYKAVPAGTTLVDGEPVCYWHPKYSHSSVPFGEAMEHIEGLLLESISRLTRGRAVGIALGGVDSSLICALARKLYPNRELHTYSVGFIDADEFQHARRVADRYATVHREILLHATDYIGSTTLLRPLIRHKGAPLHPNELALAHVERVARLEGCDIVLCGEGADDIFGGYGQNMRMYMDYAGDRSYAEFVLGNYRYFSLEDRAGLVRDEYLVDDVELLNSLIDNDDAPKNIRDMMLYFIQRVHTVGLITRGANAMRFNGLPIGFPYICPELVDYVNALPFDYKVRWKSAEDEEDAQGMYFRDVSEVKDIPKYILKKLSEKYLPRDLVYRRKCAFPIPFESWLSDLGSWPLDANVFKTEDLSNLSGWKKFMIINLNTFIEEFKN